MSDTTDRLLDLAHDLVQKRGLGNVSFRDLAEPLGVTHAAVHYHFRSKADLARALVARYRGDLLAALAGLDHHEPADALRQFLAHYESGARRGRFCLCGMMASDAGTLSDEVQAEVRQFFHDVEAWLAGVFERGRPALVFEGRPDDQAAAFLGTVEGAMLTARPFFSLGPDVAAQRFRTVVGPMRVRLHL